MKTLREYIDILDEISRRDALKYAGATAAGAALGGGAGFYKGAEGQVDKNVAYDVGFLWGFTAAASENLKKERVGKTSQILIDMNTQVKDLIKRVGSDIQKNPWYSYGYSAGIKHFHSRVGLTGGDQVLKDMFDTLLDRARQSSYGQPQKIFKEEELEETTEEDPIAKIDQLFKNK